MRDFEVEAISSKVMKISFYPHECGLSVPRLSIKMQGTCSKESVSPTSSAVDAARSAYSSSQINLLSAQIHPSQSAKSGHPSTSSPTEASNLNTTRYQGAPSNVTSSLHVLPSPSTSIEHSSCDLAIKEESTNEQNVTYRIGDSEIVIANVQEPSPPVTGNFTLIYTDGNGRQYNATGNIF